MGADVGGPGARGRPLLPFAARRGREHTAVIELHLIGYTEDLGWLVLDRDPDGAGTHTLALDDAFLEGLDEVLAERRTAAAAPVPAAAASAVADAHPPVASAPDVKPATGARLTPAEIQAQLRAGRSVRAVAKDAGVPTASVERWLGPILGERGRILDEARALRPEHASGRRTLGDAVDRGLQERGVDPASARWQAARRDDGRWKVTVRFEHRGKPRTATWLYDRDSATVRPKSPTGRSPPNRTPCWLRRRRCTRRSLGGPRSTKGPTRASPPRSRSTTWSATAP